MHASHDTLDVTGQIRDAWSRRADETARQPWPTTPEQDATWSFDPTAQCWSKT